MDNRMSQPVAPAGVRVLVVEDDPDAREIVTSSLTAAGYHVEQAEDGARAIELALDSPFDVILLDLELPKVNGLDVLNVLQSCPDTCTIPVLIMTTHDEPEFIEKCFRLGVDGYLLKPLQRDYLVGMLDRLLEGQTAEPETMWREAV